MGVSCEDKSIRQSWGGASESVAQFGAPGMADVDDLFRRWEGGDAAGADNGGETSKYRKLDEGLDFRIGIGYSGWCNAKTIPRQSR